MAYENPLLDKEYLASGAITKYRIVKWATTDGVVSQSAAATDKHMGVSKETVADGARVRVARIGIAQVEAGGTIAKGDLLTADANGKAITTVTGSDRIIGQAEVAAVSGDIFPALLSPGII